MPPISPTDQTTLFAAIIAIFTPALVDVIKRGHWTEQAVTLLSLLVSTVLYVALHLLMGTLPWPMTFDFFIGLFAVWAAQQLTYKSIYKHRVVEVPVPAPAAPQSVTMIAGDVKEA